MVGAVLQKVFGTLLGNDPGWATKSEIVDLAYRNKLSDYLPFLTFDDETTMYHNVDDTVGFIWECTPLTFSADKTLQISETLTRLQLPSMSVIQLLLHADENIKPFLEAYRHLRSNSPDPLVHDAVESYCSFLQSCTEGLPQLSRIPLRNIRLIFSLKMPVTKDLKPSDIQSTVFEALNAMHLVPRLMKPPALLEWLRRLFNDGVPERKTATGIEMSSVYNDNLSISKQVIRAETEIVVDHDNIQIGESTWRCITPKIYPQEVDPLQTKELFGGIWGVRNDNEQHRTPFLYALNIIFDPGLKGTIRNKCDLILAQSAAGSFARSLQRKQDEHKWAIDKVDQGKRFVRIMPMMWFIGDSPTEAEESMKRGKTMWEAGGYTMQEEKGILMPLLLSSLPLGMRANKQNLNTLERDTIVDPDAVCNVLPVQGDFSGSNEAVMLLQGRTGQIAPISIFSKRANNFNGFCAGTSGGGKSFGINSLIFAQYTAGTIMRIVDIGGSYKRQCHIFGGDYLDFSPGNKPCMNPFSNISKKDEDCLEDLAAISAIVMQMAYSSSDAPNIDELEYKIIKDAVGWAYSQKRNDASVDDVYDYLVEYPKYVQSKRVTPKIQELAHHLAFNIFEFTSNGKYGDYFVGKSTFDISNSKFLLLELEALKNDKDLFKVVTLLVLDAVTRDLYLSDRSNRRMVIFDEAWQFLSGASGNRMMADIIESGFRRARKYGGSFLIITQSLLDRQVFGPIGDIIWNNADYKILLESKDFDKALAEKLISYDPFTVELLKSVQKNSNKYSEFYMDTPYGAGIVRLAVDAFSYYLFTSDAAEISEMDTMVAQGKTYREAIHEMVRKYRSPAPQAAAPTKLAA